MSEIRILQIVPNMQAGGLETFIMNVYRNIDKSKVQFDFLVHYTEEKFYDKEIEKLGGKIYRFSLRNDNNIFKYIKELNDFFSKHKEYKIIHCHMASIGALIFAIAKKNGIKYRIAHSHNTNTEKNLKGIIKSILIKPYKYFSSYNFACSNDAGNFLFKNKKFEILYNGIYTEKFAYNEEKRIEIRKKLGISDELVIGHVGRMCEQKNHLYLLDIFYHYNKVNPKSKLLLIGTGELEDRIKEKVTQLNIEKNVLMIGNKDNVNDYYNAMDCFILPSKFEGLGIVAIEAQSSGLLCLISDNIPIEADVVPELVTRLSIKQKPSNWIKNINRSKDRIKFNEVVKNSNYDINKVVDKLTEIYIKFHNRGDTDE